MSDFLIAYIASLEHLPFVVLFLLLAFSGYLVPVPEEVVLLIAGYLGSVGALSMLPVVIVCFSGILAGDIILYELARHGSGRVAFLRERLEHSEYLRRHPHFEVRLGRSIFLMRFIIGLRFFGPVVAGSHHVSRRFFLTYDVPAILIYVPIFVFLGYHSYDQILPYFADTETLRHALFFVGLVLFSISIYRLAKRKLAV